MRSLKEIYMRKIFILLLLLSGFLWGQANVYTADVTQSKYLQITLDSTDTDVVYLLWEEAGSGGADFYLSETIPAALTNQPYDKPSITKGGLAISVVLDTITAGETDSLNVYVQSFNWDGSTFAYYASTNDTIFLDFDTPGTYTGTSADQLNWIDGRMYTADLGGVIMPGTGLKISFVQAADDSAGADATASIGVHLLK
jgi:hypothetical protein